MSDDNRTDLQRAEQDNRNKIIAHWQIDHGYLRQQLDQANLLIGLQAAAIKRLEAELEAWRLADKVLNQDVEQVKSEGIK